MALVPGANARVRISMAVVRAATAPHRRAMVRLCRANASHWIPNDDHRPAKARHGRATAGLRARTPTIAAQRRTSDLRWSCCNA
jgi:hypothetical protein